MYAICNSRLPWWLSSKESACNAEVTGEMGSIPGLGRSPGGEHGNPLQYSCLENLIDRGAWWATVHRVTQIWTWLKGLRCMCTFIKATCSDGRVREAEWILIIKAFLSLHASWGHRGKCLKPIGLELAENPWKCFEIFPKFTPSQGYRISNSTVLLKFLWIEHTLWVRLRGPHLDERGFLLLFWG